MSTNNDLNNFINSVLIDIELIPPASSYNHVTQLFKIKTTQGILTIENHSVYDGNYVGFTPGKISYNFRIKEKIN